MSDLLNEELLTFTEAAAIFPGRRPGKRLNRCQIHRWATNGLRGVKLESVQAGVRYTSRQALERFVAAVTRLQDGDSAATSPPSSESRRGPAEAAGDLLRPMLFKQPPRGRSVSEDRFTPLNKGAR